MQLTEFVVVPLMLFPCAFYISGHKSPGWGPIRLVSGHSVTRSDTICGGKKNQIRDVITRKKRTRKKKKKKK
jgi:hypothetical protein